MVKIIFYSVLLIFGMLFSQLLDLSVLQPHLTLATMVCLSYIMLEVGLEFSLDKGGLKTYGKDFLIACTAATFPWFFCAVYFHYVIQVSWVESLTVGLFAAPTSAGILFAMLAAAGLATTWLFKRARMLAIFDDLATILLIVPLEFLFVGPKIEFFYLMAFVLILFYLAYTHLHSLKVPIGGQWLLFYSFLVVVLCQLVEWTLHVRFEVLLPAFALGAILYNPHDPSHPEKFHHEHAFLEHQKEPWLYIDYTIKNIFMFLVGCSLPKIPMATFDLETVTLHVLALTFLSNIGKMFPAFCYKKEAVLRERIALSIAMFPRGEVGAGVLFVALSHNLSQKAISLAVESLALNLILTGVFIGVVIKILEKVPNAERPT